MKLSNLLSAAHLFTALTLAGVLVGFAPKSLFAQDTSTNLQNGDAPGAQPPQNGDIAPNPHPTPSVADSNPHLVPSELSTKELDDIQKAYDDKAYARAIMLAQQALNKAPQNHALYTIIGNAYLLNGAPQQAIPFLTKAARYGANHAPTQAALCLSYAAIDHAALDDDPTLDICMNAAKLIPGNAALQFKTAELLREAERIEESIPYYKKAYEIDGESLPYLTALTSNLAAVGDDITAYELTAKMIEKKPVPILYHNIAIYARRAHLGEKSIRWATLGYEKFNDNAFLITIACAQFEMARYDLAFNTVQSLADANFSAPYDSRYRLIRAKVLFSNANPDALADFDALKNNPIAQGDPQFRWMFALSYVLNRKFDDARQYANIMTTSKDRETRQMAHIILAILPLFQANSAPDIKTWNALPNTTKQRAVEAFKAALRDSASPDELNARISDLPQRGMAQGFIDAIQIVKQHQDEDYTQKSTGFCTAQPRTRSNPALPAALTLFFTALFEMLFRRKRKQNTMMQ